MISYELLLPLITLFAGLLFMMAVEVGGGEDSYASQWRAHVFVLVLALAQQLLLYRMPSALFMRGGMVLDGVSQVFSISILVLALVVHLSRREDHNPLRPQVDVMTLGATLLALFCVQTNRYFFGVIGIAGLIWTTHGALAADGARGRQPQTAHSGIIRGLFGLLAGALLVLFCLGAFSETQINEIQRIMIRSTPSGDILFILQVLILFVAAYVMGIPPFSGVFGSARSRGSWSLALGFTGVFAFVGLSFFMRWAILVFSRVSVGALELEPLTHLNIFESIRVIAGAGLILCPLFALLQQKLRASLLYFFMIPFVQILFALSFGMREISGFAAGQVIIITMVLGLAISSVQALGLSAGFAMKDCVGLGRRDPVSTLFFVFSLMAAAGLAPFFGATLLQKTLCINSWYGVFLVINLTLSGYYVARFVAMVFQQPTTAERKPVVLSWGWKLSFAAPFLVLIFMGIFWQPLYKYGAFSIRSFFGDL